MRYFYDGWRVCEEQNAASAMRATYVYGLYIDGGWPGLLVKPGLRDCQGHIPHGSIIGLNGKVRFAH